jgi:hypothetical protein
LDTLTDMMPSAPPGVPGQPGVPGLPGPPTGDVPAPPPGPGAIVPFAAPPRDRDMTGLWVGLGAGALVLVLCCLGGVLGGGFLVTFADSVTRTQVADVVRGYLGALQAEEYATAHDEYLCAAEQRKHPVGWFEDHYDAAKVIAFAVNEADVRIERQITVPATVQQQGRAERPVAFTMTQDGTRYVICGGVE